MRGSGVQVLDLSHNFSGEKKLQKEIVDFRDKYFMCMLLLLWDIPDFSGKLVVQCVIFSLLDAVPSHDLHLVQVVAHLRTKPSNHLLTEILNENHLPVDKVNLPQQLLLVEFQFSHHFQFNISL